MRFKPLLVTVLLVAVSFSPWDLTTFATILSITVVTSAVCFYIQLQVEYDFLFKLLKWIGIGKSDEHEPVALSGTGLRHLSDLPPPLAHKLSKYVDAIMRDFITSWYTDLGENDESFLVEVHSLLEHVCCSAYDRVAGMNTTSVAVKLIDMFGQHIKTFNDCRLAVSRKYPDISSDDMERCISELYETRIDLHVATRSQASELDYLKTLTDVILFVLAPKSTIKCIGGRFILREILAIQLLKMLVDMFTDASFLNQALIDIFEEPLPVEELYRRWAEEYDAATNPAFGRSGSEYEKQLSELSDSDMKMLSSREDISGDIPESTDNTEAKFATPQQTSSDSSSDEYQTINQVLQQNQLEAKVSAPVYGSTVVGCHGDYTQQTPNSMTPRQGMNTSAPVPQTAVDYSSKGFPAEPGDSGITSMPRDAASAHGNAVHNGMEPNHALSKSWTVCPERSSPMFKHDSFTTMPTDQDRTKEQLKAKMRLFRGSSNVIGCCSHPEVVSYNELPFAQSGDYRKYTDSMNGSVAISVPDGQSIYAADSETSRFDNIEQSDSVEEEDCMSHASGKDGKFYDVAPQCPTCVEMKVLAGPVSRRKVILEKIVSEHVCGLSMPHYYQAYVTLSSSSSCDSCCIGSDVSSSFGSIDNRSCLESSIATTASSGTLLASYERSLDSDCSSMHSLDDEQQPNRGILKSQLSYDILSLAGEPSEHAGSLVDRKLFSKENTVSDSYQADYVIPRRTPRRRNNSIATFKSLVDSYSADTGSCKVETESSPTKPYATPRNHKDKHHTKVKRLRKVKRVPKKRDGILGFFRSAAGLKGRQQGLPSRDSDGSSIDFEHLPKDSNQKVRFEERNKMNAAQNQDNNLEKSCTSNSEEMHPSKYFSPRRYNGDRGNRRVEVPHSRSVMPLGGQPHYGSLPGGINNMYEYPKPWSGMHNENDELSVEEVGDEISEDMYEDATPGFNSDSPRPLLNGSQISDTSSELHFVTDQFSAGEVSDSKLEAASVRMDVANEEDIPIVKGEVFIRQPSQVPASAWLYPIQMISIPMHEVAYERGWEPGGNKYTLYIIQYDIRIWPDSYKTSLEETCTCEDCMPREPGSCTVTPEIDSQEDCTKCTASQSKTLTLIREIKRRYREFIYLHNRLTHGPMAEHMKGILRPNRRYAMPFGRMDPDVIEGRRKILEYYLVSLVSRTEVCNSREFKEFLGAEGYGNVSFVKPQPVKPKLILNRQMNRIMTGIRTAFPSGGKDVAEKSSHAQYFIHGYDIPRMFGYADDTALDKHSCLWQSHFVKTWLSKQDEMPEQQTHDLQVVDDRLVFGAVEFQQNPKILRFHPTTKRGVDDVVSPPSDSFSNSGKGRRENTAIAALFADNHVASEVDGGRRWLPVSVNSGSSAQWPLANSILTLVCHALRGFDSWMTFENFQQATLFGVGGLVEWGLTHLIGDIVIKERWLKYLSDLYDAIWCDDKLRDPAPPLTADQQRALKQQTLKRLMEFIPAILMMSVGPSAYRTCCENLLESIQYKRINRHVLYAALEIIMSDFVPEFQDGFQEYVDTLTPDNASK